MNAGDAVVADGGCAGAVSGVVHPHCGDVVWGGTIRAASPLDAGTVGDILADWIAATDWMPQLYSRAEIIGFAGLMIDRGWVKVALAPAEGRSEIPLASACPEGGGSAPKAAQQAAPKAALHAAQKAAPDTGVRPPLTDPSKASLAGRSNASTKMTGTTTRPSRVLGFIARDQTYVHALYVAAPGQGVGRALLTAAKADVPCLELRSFVANPAAQRFYERMGFVATAHGNGADNDEGLPDILYAWHDENIRPDLVRSRTRSRTCSGAGVEAEQGASQGPVGGQGPGQDPGQGWGQIKGQTKGQTSGRTCSHTSGQTRGQTSGQTSGQTRGQTSGQTRSQTSSQITEKTR